MTEPAVVQSQPDLDRQLLKMLRGLIDEKLQRDNDVAEAEFTEESVANEPGKQAPDKSNPSAARDRFRWFEHTHRRQRLDC
jgi:hypothetical protein